MVGTSSQGRNSIEKLKSQFTFQLSFQLSFLVLHSTKKLNFFIELPPSYLGMNSHHLNKNWERVIFNIACLPFDESHTAEAIYNRLISVLTDWDILHMTGPCLRDNAANMKAAFNLPQCSLRSLGCINHTLQLAINDEIFKLPSVETLIKKCKTLAGFANSSTTFYNEFYKEQRLRGITDRQSLKQDVDTR